MRKLVTSTALGIIFGASGVLPSLAQEIPKVTPSVTPVTPTILEPVIEKVPVIPKTIVPLPDLKTVLPVIGPNSLIPTDLTPMFHMNILPNNSGMSQEELVVAANNKDERYQFTGVWLSFLEGDESSQANNPPYAPIALTEPVEKLPVKKSAFVEYMEKQRFSIVDLLERLFNRSEAVFMPTKNADYSKIAKDNMLVKDGALLVRAGRIPVTVTTKVNGETVSTRIRGGALALISTFDKQTIVINLTDNRLSAVICEVPAPDKRILPITIPSGQIAEVYPVESNTVSNLVAKRVLVNQRTRDDIGLLISDCNYVRTMNKFRLTPALPKHDFNRVLKTAAALAYVRRSPISAATPVPKKSDSVKSAPATNDKGATGKGAT